LTNYLSYYQDKTILITGGAGAIGFCRGRDRGVCWGSGLEISLFTILLISGGFPIALPFCL